MVIFHLKHSYLNWRVNPCRRKRLQFFQHIFLNLTFFIFVWTQSKFSSAWHDNQFFFLFIHFFSFFEWSTLGNVTCRGWPSSLKHIFSYEDRFERVGFLVQDCLYHFCPRGYGSKVFPKKNGQFLIDMPQDINQGDFRVSRSWDFVLLMEKVWKVWNS